VTWQVLNLILKKKVANRNLGDHLVALAHASGESLLICKVTTTKDGIKTPSDVKKKHFFIQKIIQIN
jgi:hypothetical protein